VLVEKRFAMVGKPMPPKKVSKPDMTAKDAGTYSLASPPIVQGAASAAAGAALQSEGRDESPRTPGNTWRRDKGTSRLVSLDAFRGFIMTMLAASGFGLARFAAIDKSSEVWQVHNYEFWQKLAFHFDHPAWRSAFDFYKVSFWDLIQPAFMFMVGVAMPFSYARRSSQNQSFLRQALHAFIRAVALVLIGVFLQSGGREHTTWEFPNVLCQIGLGYFFAWCLLNFKPLVQGVALIAILIGYWGLFFFNPPPADYDYASVSASAEEGQIFEGRFAAWSKNANAAFFFDRWLLPQLTTVPDSDSSEGNAAALPQMNGDSRIVDSQRHKLAATKLSVIKANTAWKPAVVILDETVKDSVGTEPGATQIPTSDAPVSVDSTTDVSSDSVAVPEPLPIETPAADSVAEEAMTPPPTGPGWIRRVLLRNDVSWTPNRGGYATLSFVPSIGTTLLGMLCGQLLLSVSLSHWKKLGILIVAAGICLGLGILADITVCPIVKRIWTPSWVLFSGGYVIGMLALFYLFFDIAPLKFVAFPLVVVGTNSILIYLLGSTIGGWTRTSVIRVHFAGLIEAVFGSKALDPNWYEPITLATDTFVIFWLFLYWLHRQKIYLRL
jgi:predicted acyltransferase